MSIVRRWILPWTSYLPGDPREVVLRALHHNSASVVLAHNHPSGSAQPSSADESLTRTLKAALALIDIRVIDHIIVGTGEVFSFAEKGLL